MISIDLSGMYTPLSDDKHRFVRGGIHRLMMINIDLSGMYTPLSDDKHHFVRYVYTA